MRKYVSLGAAMMMGVVIGKQKETPQFLEKSTVTKTLPHKRAVEAPALEMNHKKLTKHHKKEAKFHNKRRENSSPRTSVNSSVRVRVQRSRSFTSKKTSIRSKSSPRVKQAFCGFNYAVPHGHWFNCWDATDTRWK